MEFDKVDSKRSAAPKNKGPCIVKLAIFGQTYCTLSALISSFVNLSGLILSTSNTLLILLTNETMASNNPIGTAIVKFTNTVNKNVVTSTSESDVRIFNILPNVLYSLILNATTIRIGAILASGIWDANGANNNKVNKTNTLWKIPE